MRKLLSVVDSINRLTASAAQWLVVILVVVGMIGVVARYAFNAPTIWGYDTVVMLGGSLYALGWGYAHLLRSHIRVDVFYSRFSSRGKATVDVVLCSLFFFPLMVVLLKTSVAAAWHAWAINEVMVLTYWWPPAAPFRTAIAVGVFLLFLQGLATFTRDLYFLIRRKPIA